MAKRKSHLPKPITVRTNKVGRTNSGAIDGRTAYHDISRSQRNEEENIDPFYMEELENLR